MKGNAESRWVSSACGFESYLHPPAVREIWLPSLDWEDPLEEDMAIHSSMLAWRIPMDRGTWQAIVHGVAKSWTWLSNFHFHFAFSLHQSALMILFRTVSFLSLENSLWQAWSKVWRRQWHPTPVLLPGKSHGWRSLVGCSPWGR